MYKESFALKLKEARKKSGYTQQEVAEEIKMTQQGIAYIESGKGEPNIETLCTLIDLYDIQANWLLGTKK